MLLLNMYFALTGLMLNPVFVYTRAISPGWSISRLQRLRYRIE
jgi:hypothetical protein